MIFKGLQKESLIEWPGKICAVVFVSGCNFRCPYCHNRDLVLTPEKLPDIDEREILAQLKENKNLLDGLIITGGEPLMPGLQKNRTFKDLLRFIKKVKTLGLEIGIETNGSNPETVDYLVKNKLIDYIAMDIKTILEPTKYQKAAGVKVDVVKIKRSIKIIMDSGVDYEFKTTVVPGIVNKNDILEIAKGIGRAKRYVLQQFQIENTLDEKLKEIKPYSKDWFEGVAQEIKEYLPNVELRV